MLRKFRKTKVKKKYRIYEILSFFLIKILSVGEDLLQPFLLIKIRQSQRVITSISLFYRRLTNSLLSLLRLFGLPDSDDAIREPCEQFVSSCVPGQR